jgi:hypothetical protein
MHVTIITMNGVEVHEDGVINHLKFLISTCLVKPNLVGLQYNSTSRGILWDYSMHLCVNFLWVTKNPNLLLYGYDRCVLIIVFHHHNASLPNINSNFYLDLVFGNFYFSPPTQGVKMLAFTQSYTTWNNYNIRVAIYNSWSWHNLSIIVFLSPQNSPRTTIMES